MKGGWYYVTFPHDVYELFGTRRTVFMVGTVNDVPIQKSLMPIGNGSHMLVLSADLRRQARAVLGSEVSVVLTLAERPDQEEAPSELAAIFELLPDFEAAWLQLKGSVQRGILHWLLSAKTTTTREKRAAEVLRRYEERISWFDGSYDRRTD